MKSDGVNNIPTGDTLLYKALFIIPVLAFFVLVLLFFYISIELASRGGTATPDELSWFGQITQWFDPVFFQYNLALLTFAVAIVPLVTLFYVRTMGVEKQRRLKRELPSETFTNKETAEYISAHLEKTFTIQNYIGSMMTLTFIIMLGAMIILLLKPMPSGDPNALGVDFSKGANFLMLGPYMQDYVEGDTHKYTRALFATLTAFQFGFLGAYVYFIGHLVRSYFTLDLTPNIFVSSSIRMITGSLLALVLCFIFLDPNLLKLIPFSGDNTERQDMLINGLPVWSFFIGFFPSRGLTLIGNISTKVLGLARIRERAAPLSDLPGMNYAHEIRLNREGYDNIENLANANALDLALHTGFNYNQLVQWINQARLHGYLGNDYGVFADRTGITRLDHFIEYWHAAKQNDPNADPASKLIAATQTEKHGFGEKIYILGRLAEYGKATDALATTPRDIWGQSGNSSGL